MLRSMAQWWERLQETIDELGWSKAELSRRSHVSYDRINKYLRGEVEQPRGDVLATLAATVQKSVLWLRDGIDEGVAAELTKSASGLVPATIVGRAQAGAWLEVDEFDQSELEHIALPPDARFPNAQLLVFDVAGDSMNALKPHPILPGSRVVGVAYDDVASQVPLRDGLVVVVERSRDGGHSRELSVKQVEFHADRVEFHPRSTNPRHKPIVVEHDAWADQGVTIRVAALVRQTINDMPF